jgi:hypothetical protein
MADLINSEGVIYISAPNYRWPHEPHLNIWTPKINPSKKLFFRVGKILNKNVGFLEHLNLVKSDEIIDYFLNRNMIVDNLALEKLKCLLFEGGTKNVVHYRLVSNILILLSKFGLSGLIYKILKKYHMYPSIEICVKNKQLM